MWGTLHAAAENQATPAKISGWPCGKVDCCDEALELRLKQLNRGSHGKFEPSTERLPYPKVFPKFRNPDHPSETWGRGKQPRWLTAQLRTGKRIDDLRIERAAA
jgi:DNA-binding protein H-NS